MNMDFNETGFFVGNHREWDFEAVDSVKISLWLSDNMNLNLVCGLLYVSFALAGKNYMENQPRYNLRRPMLIWSLLLAIFSILGSLRVGIVMIHVAQNDGFRGLICSHSLYKGPISRFWGPIFVFSKVLEYVDTAFIILRKQKLIFLHWYHHLTVCLFSWWCYASQYAGGGVYTFVNLLVHSVMYTYYAIRAAGFKVPRPIAILITSSQIAQMVVGCAVIFCAYLWQNDSDCNSSFELVLYGGLMYFSYFLLFVHFFYKTYLKKKALHSKKETLDPSLSKQPSNGAISVDKNCNVVKPRHELRQRKLD